MELHATKRTTLHSVYEMKNAEEQSLVEASAAYFSDFFYAKLLPLPHVEMNTLKISSGIN